MTLKDHEEIVVLDGLNVVKKYQKFCGKLHKIFFTSNILESDPKFFKSIPTQIKQIVSKEEISEGVGYKYHRGIIAVGEKPEFKKIENHNGENTIILNGVVNAENVGSICRSLAAFNIDNLILDQKSCSPFLRRAVRVSMGNVFKLNIFRVDRLDETISMLKEKKIKVYSADYRKEAISTKRIEKNHATAIIIGSEGHGIDQELYDISDKLIKIDVDPDVEYLNASVATSILAYWLAN